VGVGPAAHAVFLLAFRMLHGKAPAIYRYVIADSLPKVKQMAASLAQAPVTPQGLGVHAPVKHNPSTDSLPDSRQW